MAILNDLIKRKITFGTAVAEAGQWASKLINSNPAAKQAVSDTLSAIKQGASNMIMLADTELADHFTQLVTAVEGGADAALMGATGGKILPAVPLVNATIEQIAAAGKVALDAWAMQAKANLLPAPAVQQGQPTPPPPPPSNPQNG